MSKILIINNDDDTIYLLERFLEKNNFQADSVKTDEDVFEKISEFNPDLIL